MNENFVKWNAATYFKRLLDINVLALSHRFVFCNVAALQGLEDMLHLMKNTANFFAVSDSSDGYLSLSNAVNGRRVYTVFMAMRHAESDMKAREKCLFIMREIFRQMMSVLMEDRKSMMTRHIIIDPRIQFSEIDSYFFSGCACAYFQIAVDYNVKLCVCNDEWTESPFQQRGNR